MISIPANEQRTWRVWDLAAPLTGDVPEGHVWPQEAAYCDEQDGRRVYIEVQYRNHAPVLHYGKRFPAARYWWVEGIASHERHSGHALRTGGAFPTFEEAMTAGRNYLAAVETFLTA